MQLINVRSIVSVGCLALLIVLAAPRTAIGGEAESHWVGTWATTLLPETAAKDAVALADSTVRQSVHVSLGGDQIRVRFSNLFGMTPVSFHGAHVALAAPNGAVVPGTDRALSFGGRPSVTIPAGAIYFSDPIELKLPAQADLAISIHFDKVPDMVSLHGGSRTSCYVKKGDHLADAEMADANKIVRWYFTSGVEVLSKDPRAAAVVTFGDSITDGYGIKTDTNDRWPDELLRRLQAKSDFPIALLNSSNGGNCMLRGGLGPNGLARFDRDVLALSGARWLVVLIGINDIGGRVAARKHNGEYSRADDLIAGFEQIITRAKIRGLKVVGSTILPFGGNEGYWCDDGEADRQAVNKWIRTSGKFDAVIDFDAALRDPNEPTRLAAQYDCGDHLHPSTAGYLKMAATVDLGLFSE